MPSEIVHVNITKAAMTELRRRPGGTIVEEISEGILKGVVDPDKTPDTCIVVRRPGSHPDFYRDAEARVDHYRPNAPLVDYYLDLSLYHLRKENDRFKAGFMLGRALHYVQDESFKRVISKYSGELATSPERIIDLCRVTFVGGRKESSIPEEAICIALKRSIELLEKFVKEYRKPVDVHELERKLRMMRLMKIIAFFALSALIGLKLPDILIQHGMPAQLAAFIAVFAIIYIGVVIAAFRSGIYREAMRAGMMIIKPRNYEPAY